jgi:DNA repair protein RecN (Recombination protein N)
MLRQLTVRNYALIDMVQLHFEPGLTAVTGETGSGKSILLGAFSLLLGDRADYRAIRDESTKCIAEAQFEISRDEFGPFFQAHDLDFEPVTTIRREITAGGKSRSFVNDTPVSLQVLKALGEMLVDLHSQHENSILGDRDFQFSVLDAFADHRELLQTYTTTYREYRGKMQELDALRTQELRLQQNLDYIRFQLGELEQIRLDEISQTDLEQELDTLTHAETIRSALWSASEVIDGDQQGAAVSLQQVRSLLSRISHLNPALAGFLSRMESLLIECRELASEMSDFAGRTESDEARMQAIQEILNELYRLQQKHRVQTAGELVALRDALRSQTLEADGMEDKISHLAEETEALGAQLASMAGELHRGRLTAAEKAEQEVLHFLEELQLGHALLHWELSETEDFTLTGRSDVRLLFRANKGGQLLPVRQVASGGEISRVMLALKAAIARHKRMPVLILDEIDQGVSGEVALRIGAILQAISSDLQVITITHLPQIAGKASHHFKVMKSDDSEITRTDVIPLEGEARVNELAEMLGGKKRSQSSLEHARELLLRN